MEQERLPFMQPGSCDANAVLPPQNQAEMDELRRQSVGRAAMTSSQFNQMTYEQLAQFHVQQVAMSKRMEDESSRQAMTLLKMDTKIRDA
ncbi:hypothetical protein DYB25_005397 [Aphanomyces astaci]|uniref:Uncharacterized protein n=1 Tax=Aphanomyces astaci TaxID=112090 RepID=A0A397C669_APHAT|nr:hypothetical protein DYB25_005397 [Aphanomyces astaci]RHY40169.1 hypothetical protein DYB30_014151 [Aphanomyces astaci]RHY71139.1 hypothetical protein DYB34_013861 [Aphanomyces astaci]RHY73986.1 hypothetical protein DYB38_013202 [Aphanomyces astaci]RHZ32169.1 hypothetical protein DYB31_011731 [Aphanomyces astaci]